MRKVIISAIGLGILFLGFLGFKGLSESKKAPEKHIGKEVMTVYSEKVINTKIPITIETNGSILAKDRMVIYSEVQGVFVPTSKEFKPGVTYSKGQQLLQINNEEFIASVVAQRSAFKNIITSILADIKFDYPNSLIKWEAYLDAIDINKKLPELPNIDNKQEKNFITGKTIYSTFYSIKNLEARLKKYSINAPYKGVLVEALVTPGTLVSSGQKLGTYIREGVFELELNVNANLQEFLKVGTTVDLTTIENNQKYEGKVIRVNPQIDRASQTIQVFVEVRATTLKEGEYLQANVKAKDVEKGIELDRTLLINNNSIYIIDQDKLKLVPVNVVYENMNTVVIQGLLNGLEYISKPIPGAFEGMSVKQIATKTE